MDSQNIIPGMLVKISIGTGKYGPGKKWASIIRVVSVNTIGKQKIVTGMQYMTIATRGGDHNPADHYKYTKSPVLQGTSGKFDEWWQVFNAKILV